MAKIMFMIFGQVTGSEGNLTDSRLCVPSSFPFCCSLVLPCSSGTTSGSLCVGGVCLFLTERKYPDVFYFLSMISFSWFWAWIHFLGVYCVKCWIKINIVWFICDKIWVILELLRCVAWEVKYSTQVLHVWLGIFAFTQLPIYPYMHVSQEFQDLQNPMTFLH